MASIVYIHGFLSSPSSFKARVTQEWLSQNRADIRFHCPFLSSYPSEAKETLDKICSDIDDDLYLIGSSLGGFWSTYLVESGYASKAVLINPGVLPHTRFEEFLGQTLKSYYSEDTYCLKEKDLDDLAACDFSHLADPKKYWLMAQKGDEVLDYRLAENKYQGAKQTIEENGNHSFEGYEGWLPEIIEFFGC